MTKKNKLRSVVNKAQQLPPRESKYAYPIKPPEIMPGVIGKGFEAPVMATDYAGLGYSQYFDPAGSGNAGVAVVAGFPGYPYLSMLATKPEYRAFADTMSTELTREWIEFTSKQDDDTDNADKIKLIEAEFKRLKVRDVFNLAAKHDCNFGRAQIFIDLDTKKDGRKLPLVLDPRTVKKGSLKRLSVVEAIWTTPLAYNALDPTAPDFYKPNGWWMLGQQVHASRLMTIVTRPLPDMLKPAFNFSGMSLFQLAEPYVDNWIRTRQSVSDLINTFSITILATAMDQVLQGTDDGTDLLTRIDLFNATKSNRGMMLVDKEREEVVQVNTPLGTLDALQAQSQEHMCSVSRTPAIILTGISPTGLNASSEGEIRVFYDWIAAQQEAYWREPLETILQVVQLSLFGEIDPDINFDFVPLYQLTGKELAEIRKSNADTATAYVDRQILAPEEVRQQLAEDPESGYMGLDTSVKIEPPADPSKEEPPDGLEDGDDKPAQDMTFDAEFSESDHPRAENGQFGTGSNSEGKPNSPHHKEGKLEFQHNGKADLSKQGFKPKRRGDGGSKTEAAQVGWGHAQAIGKPATVVMTGRGWAVLSHKDAVARGQPHLVVTQEGEVHAYNGKHSE